MVGTNGKPNGRGKASEGFLKLAINNIGAELNNFTPVEDTPTV